MSDYEGICVPVFEGLLATEAALDVIACAALVHLRLGVSQLGEPGLLLWC